MKKFRTLLALSALAVAFIPAANAHDSFSIGLNFGVPAPYYAPPVRYYAPPPVVYYEAAPPVYYAAPPTVIYRSGYYGGGYQRGHRWHDHDRWDRGDRDGYRGGPRGSWH